MKKLIFILAALFALVGAAKAANPAPVKWDVNRWTYEYTGLATDTVGAGTTTWAIPMEIQKTAGSFYIAKVKVSDVTAGATCTVALQGKYFAADAYTTIATQTWAGGGTDTTFVFSGVSAASYYRYYNVLVTRTANKAKVSYVKLMIKE